MKLAMLGKLMPPFLNDRYFLNALKLYVYCRPKFHKDARIKDKMYRQLLHGLEIITYQKLQITF